MKKKTLSRREREKEQQRQDILAAALELFSVKGYHNVSMHEIASKAEFAIGTLYKFFPNKEELYKVIMLERALLLHDACIEAVSEPKDEIEQLVAYVRARGDLFRENLDYIRLYLAETRGIAFNIKVGPYLEMKELYDDLLKQLASVFERGMKRKRLKKVAEPYFLAVALDSVVNALHLLWLDAPDRYSSFEEPRAILEIFLGGLKYQ
jgi:AcrR family transcriptional regulator